MRPREFWALHPDEFWWLAEASRPTKTYAGGMTEAEAEELYELAFGDDAQSVTPS